MLNWSEQRIVIVGPLPPPAGGMAYQTLQLSELLRNEGASVEVVQTNRPYSPAWVERLKGVRAVFRLVPYLLALWRAAGRASLFHVMANSGWAWHLFAAPAIKVARMRGVPCVVNYRGGEADSFLQTAQASVRTTVARASSLAVPSGFLNEVFGRYGMQSDVVPNIIDLDRFRAGDATEKAAGTHIVIARNLEPIYDIPTGLRAVAQVLQRFPEVRLTVAGSGPERSSLEALSKELGIAHAVRFSGRLNREEMASLYRSAHIALNTSSVDNMPNSVLEGMAASLPIVSTDVGGVRFIVRNEITALLVPSGDANAMAHAIARLITEPGLADRLRQAAGAEVQQYAWKHVKQRWARVYQSALEGSRVELKLA